MPSRPFVLGESHLREVSSAKYALVVLPWGSTEAHNYHLPYGSDTFQASLIAERAAAICEKKGHRILVLPPIPYGVNTGQLDIPMTINMNPGTQMNVLMDIVESLSLHGVEKLVILNGHGGNDFKPMIRELMPVYPDMFISTLNWWQILDGSIYFDDTGDHAGEMETCVMMELCPDLVRPLTEAGSGNAKSFAIQALREGWAWAPRQWTKVTSDTGVGNPSKASPEKGKKYVADLVEKIADFFSELAQTPPDEWYEK